MSGPPVAIGATRILVEEIQRVQREGVQIDWLIPHQANLTRILIPACAKTGIDPDRLCASFADTGNTSSASIPLLARSTGARRACEARPDGTDDWLRREFLDRRRAGRVRSAARC